MSTSMRTPARWAASFGALLLIIVTLGVGGTAFADPGNGQGALYTPVEAKKQQAKAPTKKQVAAKQAKAERSQQAKREAPVQEAQQEATSEAKGGEGDSGAGSQGGE